MKGAIMGSLLFILVCALLLNYYVINKEYFSNAMIDYVSADCSNITDCKRCAKEKSCGWCATSSKCLTMDTNFKLPGCAPSSSVLDSSICSSSSSSSSSTSNTSNSSNSSNSSNNTTNSNGLLSFSSILSSFLTTHPINTYNLNTNNTTVQADYDNDNSVSSSGMLAQYAQLRNTLKADMQEAVKNELLNERALKPVTTTTPSCPSPSINQGSSWRGLGNTQGSNCSTKKPEPPQPPQVCKPLPSKPQPEPSQQCQPPQKCPPPPPPFDMSDYVKKDSIPCYGCSLN